MTTSTVKYMEHIDVNGEKNTVTDFPTNVIFHALGGELKTQVIPVKSVDLAQIHLSVKEGKIWPVTSRGAEHKRNEIRVTVSKNKFSSVPFH